MISRRAQWKSPLRPSLAAFVIILTGLILHVVGFLIYRMPELSQANDSAAAPFLSYTATPNVPKEVDIEAEIAQLFDSAPLYMPTAQTFAATVDGAASLRDESELFTTFGPYLASHQFQTSAFLAPPTVKLSVPQLTRQWNDGWRPLGSSPQLPEPDEGGGFIHYLVKNLSSSQMDTMGTISIEPNALPPELWNPMRFLLTIEAVGLVGAPRLVNSSGNSTLDGTVTSHLASFAFYKLLAPGYYEIVIFP